MRINVDRLCELAGVPGARRSRGGLMNEAVDHGAKEEYSHMEEGDLPDGLEDALQEMGHELYEEEQEEGADYHEGKDDPENEMVEVEPADLVKELRRMKVKMHEARKIEKRRQQNLQEAQLKAIIDQEVQNVLKELNLNSGWMYGQKKPSRSKKGYTHQGSFLKGFGFK